MVRSIASPASKSMVSAGLPAMRFEELVGFDDLELVKSHLMAGRDDEPLIGRVRRPHQDLPEPLQLLRPFGDIEADFVEALLVESDRASDAESCS